MVDQAKHNEKADPEPPFACIARQMPSNEAQFAVATRDQILESLERDRQLQAKADLSAGPVFDTVAAHFREWAKTAEPGGMFRAPELGMTIIRLSRFLPPTLSLSEHARKQMTQPSAAPPADPPGLRLYQP